MLSISQTEKLPPKLAVKASLKKKSHSAMFPTREEKINKVHQDEDFIYPTLGAALSLNWLLTLFLEQISPMRRRCRCKRTSPGIPRSK